MNIPKCSFGSHTEILKNKPNSNLVAWICETGGTGAETADQVAGVHSCSRGAIASHDGHAMHATWVHVGVGISSRNSKPVSMTKPKGVVRQTCLGYILENLGEAGSQIDVVVELAHIVAGVGLGHKHQEEVVVADAAHTGSLVVDQDTGYKERVVVGHWLVGHDCSMGKVL